MTRRNTQRGPTRSKEEQQEETEFRRAQCTVVDIKVRPKKKQEETTEPWVKVPLWWIESAARHAKSPATLVLIELLYAAWKAKGSTFPLPNTRLRMLGVSRDVKRRVLRNLEQGGAILVNRPPRKTPIITLIGF
jgi:hypothetical protein